MDKNAIKSFAIDSRRKLMDDVVYRLNLVGITEKGISEPINSADGFETYDIGGTTHQIYGLDIGRRASLVREVQNKGFENVVEEVAYTWFNRIIAIRFMEVNDYLPTRTRVLSSETPGKIEPDIITEALDLDLNYTEEDEKEIVKLLDDNKLDELFRFLFIKQCNKLNEILPGLFEKTDDYMELLIGISFTNKESVIRRLIEDIPEKEFTNQVEIIGWLYQYYNSELKDETFNNLKKERKKITKDRIPAATQLFTPDWIVRYMVENSLGRLWLEGHPNEELKSKWKYYIDEVEQEQDIEEQLIKIRKESSNLKPADIKVIDPCMGSGHILVYVFDVLMQIYVSEGFSEKDAAELIIKHNIHGLDIDDRAYQLAYFAVMMKARQYDRDILEKNIIPSVYSIHESNPISEKTIDFILKYLPEIKHELEYIIRLFVNSKNYGSILYGNDINLKKFKEKLDNLNKISNLDYINNLNEIDLLKDLINQTKYLNETYDVVITNPPYMFTRNMNYELANYIKTNFKDSKTDFFSVFIERCEKFTKEYGYFSMITQPSFLFLSSFENLRNNLLTSNSFSSLLHMGRGIFGIDFGSTAFVIKKIHVKNYISSYFKLYDRTFQYINPNDIERIYLNTINNLDFKFDFKSYNPNDKLNFGLTENSSQIFYKNNQDNFLILPGTPIAYWASNRIIDIFSENKSINNICSMRQGLATGNNDKYLRLWFEVNFKDIGFSYNSNTDFLNSGYKFCPHNKGGSYRKWYGNQDYIIRFDKETFDELLTKGNHLPSRDFYFKPSISWSASSSVDISFRYYPKGFVFNSKGNSLFIDEEFKDYENYIFAFLNSKISQEILNLISPTIDYKVGTLSLLPLIIEEKYINEINLLVSQNINISKQNWNDKEISWEFNCHPLIRFNDNKLVDNFNQFEDYKENQFNIMKDNEVRLNNIFSKIYGIKIDSDVEDAKISIDKADYTEDIKSFISYSIGCMFGRYSLDQKGIQFAGGEFNINKFIKFIPDDDNIIPVLDSEYFEDDVVGLFEDFLETCFGEENLEENLKFVADALDKSKKPTRQKIRDYFLKDFFKDHVKTYKKSPIYWQFDSGKHNAFKCLIYMHRYDPTIVARVRTDYLHKTQKAIEQNIERCDNIIISDSPEKTKAEKLKSKLIKQLDEIKEYDIVLAHVANQKIEIDLDDGVKVNYAKFQNIEIQKDGQKNIKVNLLKKI